LSDYILDIAKKYEESIQRSILQAFVFLKDNVNVEYFLEVKEVEQALYYLSQMEIELVFSKFLLSNLQDVIKAGGDVTMDHVSSGVKTGEAWVFNLLGFSLAGVLWNYNANLVNKLGQNTRGALKNTLVRGFQNNIDRRTLANDFKKNIGLSAKQESAVRSYEQALRSSSKDAIRRALRDKRSDSVVERAIKNDSKLSEEQINSLVNRYRLRSITFRAKQIAQNEALRSASIGQYYSVLQAVSDGVIKYEDFLRFWVHRDDPKTRNDHKSIPELNKNGVRIDEAFQTNLGPLLFPRDPKGSAENTVNCRCTVIYKMVSEGENQ